MSKENPLVKIGDICKLFSGGTPRRGIEGFYGGHIPRQKLEILKMLKAVIFSALKNQ
ncbi:MAG: hypothetical protein IPJ75_15980 [Ignavibacteriales bacterium]|nr:hypothetical protein [Ignavibacteriales bacterium]